MTSFLWKGKKERKKFMWELCKETHILHTERQSRNIYAHLFMLAVHVLFVIDYLCNIGIFRYHSWVTTESPLFSLAFHQEQLCCRNSLASGSLDAVLLLPTSMSNFSGLQNWICHTCKISDLKVHESPWLQLTILGSSSLMYSQTTFILQLLINSVILLITCTFLWMSTCKNAKVCSVAVVKYFAEGKSHAEATLPCPCTLLETFISFLKVILLEPFKNKSFPKALEISLKSL